MKNFIFCAVDSWALFYGQEKKKLQSYKFYLMGSIFNVK